MYSSAAGLLKVMKGLWEIRLDLQLLLQSNNGLFGFLSQRSVWRKKKQLPECTGVVLMFILNRFLPFTWLEEEYDPSDLLDRCAILFSANTALPVFCKVGHILTCHYIV